MPNLVRDATGNDLTYRIIGAAMEVHNTLGPGHKEEVYERALAVALEERGMGVARQVPVEVGYHDVPVGLFVLDLLVEGLVVVELKAFAHQLTDDELGQIINYLQVAQAPVGLLLNFGRRRLEYRRVFPGTPRDAGPTRVGRDDVYKANRRQSPGPATADPAREQ